LFLPRLPGTFQGVGGDDYGMLLGNNEVEWLGGSHDPGHPVSLSDLKAGTAVPGINANTNVAIWVGITNNNTARIKTVNDQRVVRCIDHDHDNEGSARTAPQTVTKPNKPARL
jgi:hypothetical protein